MIRASSSWASNWTGSPVRLCPVTWTPVARFVGAYGPRIDRQPSSRISSPVSPLTVGFTRARAPVPSPSSNTNSRMDRPICGAASPTPGASYIVSIMSSTSRNRATSNCSTGFAGCRSTGSPSCRMGRMAMEVALLLCAGPAVHPEANPHRCGSASTRATIPRPARSRTALPNAASPWGRTVTKHTVCPSAPEASSVTGSRARRWSSSSADPATRNTGWPTGNPARSRRGRSARWNRPGLPATSACTAASLGLLVWTMTRPEGRAHPAASIHSARDRSAAASPGRRAARSASRMPTRSSPGGGTSFTASGPPTTIPAHGSAPPVPRRTGTEATRAAHSSTRSTPPRAMPNTRPPQLAQRPGASHTTHRVSPASSRMVPPHDAHRAGSPHERHTLATPYPGSGWYRNPRRAPFTAPTSRGARPSGPGRTTSTGGQARPDGATSGAPVATASPLGHRAAITQTAPSRPARATATSRTWYAGDRSSRCPGWLSREIHTRPRCGTGANTAGRVPTTTRKRPSAMSSHIRYRPRWDPPTYSATRSPKASATAAAVAGSGSASGTTTMADRVPATASPTASTARACSSSGAGRTTKAPAPPDSPATRGPAPRYRSSTAPAGRPGDASGGGAAGGRSLSSPATRGGEARPMIVARGATYRSLIHRNSASSRPSKKRTGETTFRTFAIRGGTSSVGPRTHPRVSRPWNGTWTSEPIPAPSESSRRYVNARSSARTGRSTQTATGPLRSWDGFVGGAGLLGGPAEVVGAVGLLPGEALPPEVTVRRGLAIQRPAEIEVPDDRGGPEVEHVLHRGQDPLRRDLLGPEAVHGHRHGVRRPDGVRHLELEPVGQARRDDVLGHVTGHVRRGAIHLRGVLAGEAAAAVGGHAAVRIDHDLAPGEAGVGLGAADLEPPGGVHQDPDRLGIEVVELPEHGVDDLGLHVGLQEALQVHLLAVLGGDEDGVHPDRAVPLVLDGHLALPVGPQIRDDARLADVGESLGQPVGHGDRQRHELLGVPAGEPEHHALVARPDRVQVVVGSFLDLTGPIDAQGDVGGLLLDRRDHTARRAVDPELRVRVADLVDGPPDDLWDVHVGLRGDLSGHDHQARGDEGLAGHPPVRVALEDGVQDRVGDLVGEL